MTEKSIYISKRYYIPPILHKIEMEYCKVVAGSPGTTTDAWGRDPQDPDYGKDPNGQFSKYSFYNPYTLDFDPNDEDY